jgi:tetratricopeptide (TPR) repeat protein
MTTKSDLIKLYDSTGREIFIPREEYKQKVLPKKFQDVQNDANQLYSTIVISLQDGFFTECISPAKHLLQIDPDRERATVVLAIAQMRSGELDDAHNLLTSYLHDVGASGIVLTNLAKVYADQGDSTKAEETLWSAIKTDPNQDNALDWWMAIHYERGGVEARSAAIQRVADLPGSWRAQLWLAREALETGKKDEALLMYRSVLSLAQEHGDVLMMISGDLGKKGFAGEALSIVAPVYNAEKHGPMTGLNLVQACIELKHMRQGEEILAAVEGLNRLDLKAYLERLHQQLDQLKR